MNMQTLNVHIYLGQYSERTLIKVKCNVSRFNQVTVSNHYTPCRGMKDRSIYNYKALGK